MKQISNFRQCCLNKQSVARTRKQPRNEKVTWMYVLLMFNIAPGCIVQSSRPCTAPPPSKSIPPFPPQSTFPPSPAHMLVAIQITSIIWIAERQSHVRTWLHTSSTTSSHTSFSSTLHCLSSTNSHFSSATSSHFSTSTCSHFSSSTYKGAL